MSNNEFFTGNNESNDSKNCHFNNDVVVIYHGMNCSDGFGACLAAYLKFGEEAAYFPMAHGEDPPNVVGKRVYILDFCFSKEIIEKMIKDAESLLVIDHHKTAEKELKDISDENKIFDMKKSGAVREYLCYYFIFKIEIFG